MLCLFLKVDMLIRMDFTVRIFLCNIVGCHNREAINDACMFLYIKGV